jgi:hypothetical protein
VGRQGGFESREGTPAVITMPVRMCGICRCVPGQRDRGMIRLEPASDFYDRHKAWLPTASEPFEARDFYYSRLSAHASARRDILALAGAMSEGRGRCAVADSS